MNILITGANGFIGKALTKHFLKLHYVVYALVTSKSDMDDLSDDNLHVLTMKFEDYNTIASQVKANLDLVYHLAWSGLCGYSCKSVDIQLENVKAIGTLVEEVHKLDCKKFVFASTMNTLEIREMLAHPINHKPRGVSIHVASKINAEIVARTLCYQYGIEFNCGLIAMAYGEENRSKMIPNIIISSLLRGVTPKLIPGHNLYDMVYVADIVNAFDAIGLKGVNLQTYYIGHDNKNTFQDLAKEIGNIINPNIKLEFGSYPEDNAINYELIDRSLLTKDTGWRPTADFKRSVLSTAKWIKESGIIF